MTAPAISLATKTRSTAAIAKFLCTVAKPKPQDDNAAQAYAWALQLDPKCAEAWNGIGRVEMGRGKFDKAIDAFSAAIRLNPQFAEAFIHRGVALERQGMSNAALIDLGTAAELDSRLTMAELLIYGILENQERHQEAHEMLDRGLNKRPDDPDLLFCRATLDLAACNYEAGWKGYEYRPTKLQLSAMLDEYQEWDGSPLNGKRILICREQGLGDEIMFARYITEVANRGGHVIVYCYPPLARLIARIPGVQEVVTSDRDVPEVDCWVAIGSLPLVLGAELKAETYMTVERMQPKSGLFRVGLCWKGNPAHARDTFRSMPFAALAPLLAVKGVEFVSLQQHDSESGLEGVADRCHDLYDLGCEMLGLDLVITVDTAVAHLGGALGVPTWVLLGKPTDWRWNTPLYESTMLLVNEAPKKWDTAIKSVVATLEKSLEPIRKAPKRQWPHDKSGFPPLRDHVPAAIETGESFPCGYNNFVETADTRYGKMQYFSRDIWLGRSIELYGEWSEGECDLYRRVVGSNDTVVEVGANIGTHTVVLAGLAGRVIALEPCLETFDVLESNLDTFGNVQLLQIAAGASRGSVGLLTKPNNPGGTEVTGAGEIDMSTVDYIFCNSDIDFLKLDCEGSELAVLQGAEQTIARCRPLLYVENDRADKSEALVSWIHAHGYRMYQHHAPLYNPENFRGNKVNVFGNIVSAMLFCVPNERKDLRPTEWGMERVRVVRQ